MDILHVFGRLSRGGAEMRTLDLMRYIDREQYRFHFCSLSGLPGELDKEVRSLGGEIFYTKLDFGFPRNFRRLLKSKKFHVVHSHVHLSSGLILRLAALEGISKRIAHFRSMGDGKRLTVSRRIRNQIFKGWIDRYATDILAVSKGAMSSVWGQTWEKDPRCRVLYNGLDISRFHDPSEPDNVRKEFGFPSNCKLFIHVGRMVKPKNHERVISIFNEIAFRLPNSRLLLVGRGEIAVEQQLRQQVSDFNLADKVVFAGERSDVPRLLNASDVMIFPSLWEGLPGAVLEACAAGTPVIGSDLPGVREIAEQFPSLVKFLPLNMDNLEWVLVAEEYCRVEYLERLDLITNFKNSLFEINKCTEEFCKVWDANPAEG